MVDPSPSHRGQAPCGAVEGEQAGGDLGKAHAAVGAGELLAVDRAVTLLVHHADQPVGQLEAQRRRIGQPPARVFRDLEPVDHHVHVVLALLVEIDRLRGVARLPVDHHAGVPVPGQRRELLPELPLPSPDDGRPQLHPGALPHAHDGVDDLGHRLLADLLSAGGAVHAADGGEQQPQVIVDLRDGAHRGARVLADRFLLDRDGGGEPLDHVDVGLLHLLAGTAARRRRATRRIGAAPRRRSCRRPATISPNPRRR